MGGLCSMNSINENCAQNCNHMTYFMLLWIAPDSRTTVPACSGSAIVSSGAWTPAGGSQPDQLPTVLRALFLHYISLHYIPICTLVINSVS
jgi:hypothetical protein